MHSKWHCKTFVESVPGLEEQMVEEGEILKTCKVLVQHRSESISHPTPHLKQRVVQRSRWHQIFHVSHSSNEVRMGKAILCSSSSKMHSQMSPYGLIKYLQFLINWKSFPGLPFRIRKKSLTLLTEAGGSSWEGCLLRPWTLCKSGCREGVYLQREEISFSKAAGGQVQTFCAGDSHRSDPDNMKLTLRAAP